MTQSLDIVITGASRRLGLFLTQHYLANDCRVFAITRSASDELHGLSQNDNLIIIEVGSYSHENIDDAVKKVRENSNRLHALIHNASEFSKDADTFSIEQYESFFRVHMALPSQLNLSLRDLLYDEKEPGNIVHITDIYADNPNSDYVIYCSTKAGLENLSKGFAKKFAPGIRVNAIQPGPIQFLSSHDDNTKQQVLNETLLSYEGGFLPMVKAIDSVIENPYMTGATIKVDGGRSLGRR